MVNNNERIGYKVLDAIELRRRMSESFPSVHLSLISIIQGASFGALTLRFFVFMHENQNREQIVTILPYAVISFIIIWVISFQYNWLVGVYRWTPKILDTFYPYWLGLGQSAPIYFLDEPIKWWFSNFILVLFGIFAFYNTKKNCKPEMFDSYKSYKICFDNAEFDFCFTWMLSYVPLTMSIFFYLFSDPFKLGYWYCYEVFGFIVYVIMIFTLILVDRKFLIKLHKYYNLIY